MTQRSPRTVLAAILGGLASVAGVCWHLSQSSDVTDSPRQGELAPQLTAGGFTPDWKWTQPISHGRIDESDSRIRNPRHRPPDFHSGRMQNRRGVERRHKPIEQRPAA